MIIYMYIYNVHRDKLHVYGIADCMKNMFSYSIVKYIQMFAFEK